MMEYGSGPVANKSAAGKGGITSLFLARRPWPALPERWRWVQMQSI
jgi:hypothetical protein